MTPIRVPERGIMGAKEEYERRKAEQARRDQERVAKRGFGKNHFRHPDRMVRFTFWVAAFTFCLAGVGFFQAWAFIQSERAFVGLDAIQLLDGDFIPDAPLRYALVFKNSGKATAFIDEVVTVTPISPPRYSIPREPAYLMLPDQMTGPRVGALGAIVAGGTFNYVREVFVIDGSQPLVLHDWEVGLLKTGQSMLRIYGYLSYSDDFTFLRNRVTGFCFYYDYRFKQKPTFDTCTEPAYTYAR
jgi:hypothetical protein